MAEAGVCQGAQLTNFHEKYPKLELGEGDLLGFCLVNNLSRFLNSWKAGLMVAEKQMVCRVRGG